MKQHTYKSNFATQIELCPAKSKKLTIVYIHGLYSDPFGRKPEDVKAFCLDKGLGFVRFELIGHGSNLNDFEKVGFEEWKSQVLEVVDDLVEDDLLMVGSSLGGWLSLVTAIARPERVKGIVGLAAAPDFTEDLLIYLSEEQKDNLETKGKTDFINNDFRYVFTKKLIESGGNNLLLKDKIAISCPMHLLQGMKDASMDWRKALKIASLVESENVTVKILKNSSHRLGTDVDAKEIKMSLESILTDILC